MKSIEYALKGFWDSNCQFDVTREINFALDQLGEYSQTLAGAAREKGRKKEALSRIGTIQFFLGHTYVWGYRDALEKNLISDYEKSATITDHFLHSVNYGYAKTVYEFLAALSLLRNEDSESMRFHAMAATTEIMSNRGADLAPISDAVIKLVWGKISDDSMSNLDGYFPPVLKTYIALVGFSVGEYTSVSSQERAKVITFLYEKIMPKILSGEKMRDDKTSFEKALLPGQVIFDRADSKFKYKMNPSGFQDMDLPIPPVSPLLS